MNNRPDIKLTQKGTERVIILFSSIFFIASIAFSIFSYLRSPEIIPIHFAADGAPDNYGSRISLFIIPAIATVLFFGLKALSRHPKIYNYPQKITEDNAATIYRSGSRMILALNGCLMLIFFLIELEMYRGVRNKHLPFHWWEFALITIVPIVIPILISWKQFSKKK
jgi:uncharacterized membrane protein